MTTTRRAGPWLASAAVHGTAALVVIYLSLTVRPEPPPIMTLEVAQAFVASLQPSGATGPNSPDTARNTSDAPPVGVTIPKPRPRPVPVEQSEPEPVAVAEPAPMRPTPAPALSRTATPAPPPKAPATRTADRTTKSVAPSSPSTENTSSKKKPLVANAAPSGNSRPAPAPVRIDQNWSMTDGANNGSRAAPSSNSHPNTTSGREGVLDPDYHAELERRLREALHEPPNLLANLRAEVEFRITVDGRLVQAKLLRSSGDDRFDRAVLQAVANTRMPPPPSRREETVRVPFISQI